MRSSSSRWTVLALAAAALLVLAWCALRSARSGLPDPARTTSERVWSAVARDARLHEESGDAGRRAVAAETCEHPSEVPGAAAASRTGAIEVAARWSDDGAPVSRLGLAAWGPLGTATPFVREARTGTDGIARFEDLASGSWTITSAVGGRASVEVGSGSRVHALLEIPPGPSLRGVVVDAADRPIAGAQLWLSEGLGAPRPTFGEPTDAEGRFELRAIGNARLVGAFASGYLPSLMHELEPGNRTPVALKFVLGERGGSIDGHVVTSALADIAGAQVEIDVGGPLEGRTEDGVTLARPYPLTVLTDAGGRFHVDGVATGRIEIAARASGSAPWRRWVSVAAEKPTSIEIVLPPECVVAGTVRTADGLPVSGARIEVARGSAASQPSACSASDGTYALHGLWEGEVALDVDAGERGEAHERLRLTAGVTRDWDVVLETGVALEGVVVDENGDGLAAWAVLATSEEGASHSAETNDSGRFRLRCRDRSPLSICVCASMQDRVALLVLEHVVPGEGSVTCVIGPAQRRSAFLSGTLVDEHGAACAQADVAARKLDPPLVGLEIHVECGADGSFRLGPLQPARYALEVRAGQRAPCGLGEHALGPREERELGKQTLATAGTLAAVLVSADGRPIGNAVLHLVDPAGREIVQRTHRAGEGSLLTIDGLAPSNYTLRVEAEGHADALAQIVIRAGERTDESLIVR